MLRQPLPCRGIRGNSPLGKPGPVIRKMPCPASVTQHLLAFAALQVLGCSQLHSSLMLSTRPLQRSLVDMALIQACGRGPHLHSPQGGGCPFPKNYSEAANTNLQP